MAEVEFKYDVFVSYSSANKEWVRKTFVPILEKAGLKVCDYYRDFDVGAPIVTEMERAILESHQIVLIFSPAYLEQNWSEFENILAQAITPKKEERKLLPIIFEQCKLPLRISYMSYVNFANPDDIEVEWQRLFTALGKPNYKYTKLGVSRRKLLKGSSSKAIEFITDVAGKALSDNPTYEKDLLGYSDYARAIAKFIESHETDMPLTIGIDAPWGGGKTSLMQMIKRQLAEPQEEHQKAKEGKITKPRKWPWQQEERFYTVWFDAWQYDQEESLWAALVLEIWSQVSENISFIRRSVLSIKLNWGRIDWGKLGLDILKSLIFAFTLMILVFVGFIGIAFLLGNDLTVALAWIRHYAKIFAGLGVVSVTYTIFKDIGGILISPFNLGISRYIQKPNYVDKVGFIGQFKKDFKHVVKTITQNGKWPLVVFIDDLDRCTPVKVIEVIEAINILLDSKDCIFIIGMDSFMLAKCIQAKYKDLSAVYEKDKTSTGTELGRYFLEKIVQVDFRIPPADVAHISDFIRNQLGQGIESEPQIEQDNIAERLLEAELRAGKSYSDARKRVSQVRPDLSEEIEKAVKEVKNRSFDNHPEVEKSILNAAAYLDYNPRKIKRFINTFRLQALIAHQRKILNKTISLDVLAKWILLNICWPDVVDEIMKDSNFLAEYLSEMKKVIPFSTAQSLSELKKISESGRFSTNVVSLMTNLYLYKLLISIPNSTKSVNNYLHLIQTTSNKKK